MTLVEDQGLGGSAVLTGTVPSKTLIATAEVMTEVRESAELGVRLHADGATAAAGRTPTATRTAA